MEGGERVVAVVLRKTSVKPVLSVQVDFYLHLRVTQPIYDFSGMGVPPQRQKILDVG